MYAKSKVAFLFSLLMALSLILSACAPAPAPAPATTPAPAAAASPEVIERTVVVEVEKEVIVTPTPAPVEPVEITYYTFSAAPDHLEDIAKMVEIFEANHPNIKVKVETAPWEEYFIKLQTLIAGGAAPDVFELNYENFVTYADKGLLLDVSPYQKADTSFDAGIYYPRAAQAFNYNNMQLGLPATFSTVVLFYNKDLFDQAGVAYPSKDWTWADAVEAAKKINDPANGVWGMYSPIQFWEFYKKAAQNNCKFFNDDKTEALINSSECVQALETMANFIKADKVVPTDAEMGGVSDGDLFKQGKLGMVVTGIWMFAAFKDAPFQWDIEVEPGMATKATHFFANGVSVFAAAKHPQAAYEWVKFFTSDPNMAQIRVESGWELPALNNPEYVQGYLEQTPPANRQAVFDSLEYAVVPPVIVRQSEMQDAVNRLLDQVKLGQLAPQAALDQAKGEIDALLK